MDLILQHKIEQFAALAVKAGWEWCGAQEAIPPALPVLVIQKWGITKRVRFEPDNFEPFKTATLLFAPKEKKMSETNKPTTALNLRQKLIQIYNEIDHVEKAGRNAKQNYNFVRAADVLRVVREAFAKYGVYAETNYELLGTYDIKTNSGGNMHTATVRVTIVLHDADSDESLVISGLGDGADGGDKGIYKAQTGATKNALRNGFLLPDEADPEADENVDDRTTGSYTHPASTTDMPDFQEAQHAAPRPTPAPQSATAAPSTTKASSAASESASSTIPPKHESGVTSAAGNPATVSASPEHGDAYEGPDDDGSLPTEEQLVTYRAKFKTLGDDLAAKGKLTASRSLPVNRKVHVFLLSITKAPDAKQISKNQWDNFFKRVDAATANPEVGLVGLATLVNKVNGIEPKQ